MQSKNAAIIGSSIAKKNTKNKKINFAFKLKESSNQVLAIQKKILVHEPPNCC